MVYKLKVYRLPIGTPQARGKALVNLLPLQEGEWITTFMPMPEDEATWDRMFVVFATAAGDVRRNKLSDFVRVMANGKIAMKLEQGGDALVAVQPCTDADDIRSEEHTSELQSLMRNSYAVFCLKKKKKTNQKTPCQYQYYNKKTR